MFIDFAVLGDQAGTLFAISRNGKHSLPLEGTNSMLYASKQPRGRPCPHLCVSSPPIIRCSCFCPNELGDDCYQHVGCDFPADPVSVPMFTTGTTLYPTHAMAISKMDASSVKRSRRNHGGQHLTAGPYFG